MFFTFMRAGGTLVATVEDEAVVHVFPILFWDEALQVVGDLFEITVAGKVEAICETLHVRVRRYPLPYIE